MMPPDPPGVEGIVPSIIYEVERMVETTDPDSREHKLERIMDAVTHMAFHIDRLDPRTQDFNPKLELEDAWTPYDPAVPLLEQTGGEKE